MSVRIGASRLGCLFRIGILAALVYFGSIAGQDALDYYRFQDAMKQEAKFAGNRSDVDILVRLKAFTDSVNLPPAAKNINIVRQENRIRIWSRYDKVLKLPFDYSRVVHLRPSAEGKF